MAGVVEEKDGECHLRKVVPRCKLLRSLSRGRERDIEGSFPLARQFVALKGRHEAT